MRATERTAFMIKSHFPTWEEKPMEMEMYTVLDRKLREFGQIVLARSLPSVSRELAVAVSGSDNMMSKYPEDFDLYHVGKFNAETGVITPETPTLQFTLRQILEEYKAHG